MREEIENPPIINFPSAVKGFVAGGFMGLSLFTAWNPVARLLFFAIGIAIFIDAVMPVDRSLYAITSVFFLVVSGLLAFFAVVSGAGLLYLALIIAITIVTYLDKIRRMRAMGRIR